MAAVVTFCAPSARATSNFTTNYDVLNITATIQTNEVTNPKPGVTLYTIHTVALDNATILSMLEGPDWNDGTFPTGSKLVVSWDAGENVSNGEAGDILVVDKTGTFVLYDASETLWSESGLASMTVNFFGEYGAYKANLNTNSVGSFDFTIFNNTSFEINDGENTTNLFIDTTGPSTEIYTQGWKTFNLGDILASDFTSWSDSVRADTYGAGTNVVVNNSNSSTVTVKISASGHGKGLGGYFYDTEH